jgi:D-arabinose 1-dehydrogenase-like Zn-dependent alcohol dehydrogenase
MAGVDMGITVFPLIIKNANLHGIGTGNRDSFEAMMACVGTNGIEPVIAETFAMEAFSAAFAALESGAPFGKIVLDQG